MNILENGPKTLMQAVRHFANPDVCHAYMASLKWPSGIVACPKCGGEDVGHIASRRMYQCKAKACRKQFSAKVGTIFEDSPLPLDKWFVAVWSITNAKNGISSCELARAIGITQKSAWHMLHRIRLATKAKSFQKMEGGPVEADETFIGGIAKNMHYRRRVWSISGGGASDKAAVAGLLDRKTGTVRAIVLPGSPTSHALQSLVRRNVESGSQVFTDGYQGYVGLAVDYLHSTIDHNKRYVDGIIHTNTIENFWSVFKRSMKGTYIRPSPKHLSRYLDEQILRFDQRKLNDAGRFSVAMPGIVGRRLTWKALTGQGS